MLTKIIKLEHSHEYIAVYGNLIAELVLFRLLSRNNCIKFNRWKIINITYCLPTHSSHSSAFSMQNTIIYIITQRGKGLLRLLSIFVFLWFMKTSDVSCVCLCTCVCVCVGVCVCVCVCVVLLGTLTLKKSFFINCYVIILRM